MLSKIFCATICGITLTTTGQAQVDPLAAGTARFFESHPNEIDLKKEGDRILFANKKTGIEFVKGERGFEINSLYSIDHDHDYLATEKVIGSRELFETHDLFEIVMTKDPKRVWVERGQKTESGTKPRTGILYEMEGKSFPAELISAKSVSWRREGNDSESVLHLEWKGIDLQESKEKYGMQNTVDVEVAVTLRAGDPPFLLAHQRGQPEPDPRHRPCEVSTLVTGADRKHRRKHSSASPQSRRSGAESFHPAQNVGRLPDSLQHAVLCALQQTEW